jgi:hypothetical protein
MAVKYYTARNPRTRRIKSENSLLILSTNVVVSRQVKFAQVDRFRNSLFASSVSCDL